VHSAKPLPEFTPGPNSVLKMEQLHPSPHLQNVSLPLSLLLSITGDPAPPSLHIYCKNLQKRVKN